MMIRQERQPIKSYRNRPQPARRPAPGECGTLRQQLLAIDVYLNAQSEDHRTGAAAERLWQVCHALACEQPIHVSFTREGKR